MWPRAPDTRLQFRPPVDTRGSNILVLFANLLYTFSENFNTTSAFLRDIFVTQRCQHLHFHLNAVIPFLFPFPTAYP